MRSRSLIPTALLVTAISTVNGITPTHASGIGNEHGYVRTSVLTPHNLGVLPPQRPEGSEYGAAIALEGPRLVVGAPRLMVPPGVSGGPDRDAGGFYIYVRAGAGAPYVDDGFGFGALPNQTASIALECGRAVALRWPYVFAGCPGWPNEPPGSGTDRGRVLVLNSAGPPVSLDGLFTSAFKECGRALAVIDGWLAIGCPGATTLHPGGRVILVPFDPSVPQGLSPFDLANAVVLSSTLNNDARFGSALALQQSPFQPPRLFVGVPRYLRIDTSGIGSTLTIPGAVEVYEFASGSWTFQQRLFAEPRNDGARFGTALDANRTQLVVGAPNDLCPAGTQRCGRVFRFERQAGAWTFREAGFPTNVPGGFVPGPEAGMGFGHAVALAADHRIAIGAPFVTGTREGGAAASEVGLAEIRGTLDDWNASSYRGVLRPPPLAPLQAAGGQFGSAIAADPQKRLILVGYPKSGLAAIGATRGSVWIHEWPEVILSDGFEALF